MKKLFCTFMACLVLIAFVLPVSAANTVEPIVQVYKYSDGVFDTPTTTATKGDLLLVRVAFNQSVSSLASVRVKLEFPTEKVQLVEGSFTPEIVPGNEQAGDPIFTVKDGYVVALFSKGSITSENEIAQNVTNVASFIFNCKSGEGSVDFKGTIDNALDKDFNDVAMTAKSSVTTVTLGAWSLSDGEKKVFEELKTITYAPGSAEDSKADIDAADVIFNQMTAAEKVKFKETYADLYEYYRTARTRYYDASVDASKAAVQAEVDRFVSENQEALALTKLEQVNDDNYEAVLDAIDAYGQLTGQAKVQALNYKAQLDALAEAAKKIQIRIEADKAAQEYFIAPYMNTLWGLKESDVNAETYADLMVIAAEAETEYSGLDQSNMSATMKKEVEAYHQKLEILQKRITELAKLVGEDEAIQKEIAQFIQKWHVVTRLTALTVGVDDKTAIEMMLADYDNLSEVAKQRLVSNKTMAEGLLQMIGSYNNIQGSVGGNSGIPVVPQGGTTQEVIKEVQVPVEKIVTQTLSNLQFRNVPTIVYVMIFLMGATVLTMPIPVIFYLLHRRKRNKMKGESNQ